MKSVEQVAKTLSCIPSFPSVASEIEIANTLDLTYRLLIQSFDPLRRDFLRNDHILVKEFIPTWFAIALERALLYEILPKEHIVAKKGGEWTVYMLDDSLTKFPETIVRDPFSELVLCKPIVEVICALAGSSVSRLLTTKRWINRYFVNEYIATHKDTTGDFQAVLCLRSSGIHGGGELVIEPNFEVSLSPGDMLLFKASQRQHSMRPVVAGSSASEPMRVTGICRFYEIGGREPNSAIANYE